jgi:hypothetical protein
MHVYILLHNLKIYVRHRIIGEKILIKKFGIGNM